MPINVLNGWLEALPNLLFMDIYPQLVTLSAYISANTPKGQKAPSLEDLTPPWAKPTQEDNPLVDDYLAAIAVGGLGEELTRLYEQAGDAIRSRLRNS